MPPTILKIVCAWCQKDLGTKDGKGQTGVTHGICKRCSQKMKEESKKR